MILDIILIIAWLILGIVTLIHGNISRISYGCIWFLFIAYMIEDMVEGMV